MLQGKDGVVDFAAFDQVNREAFPPNEFMETEEIARLHESDQADVVSFYDNGTFVGFAMLIVEEPLVYLFFLAIAKENRSCGYGSQALFFIKDRYPNCQIVLDIEVIDPAAANYEQRISRKSFYLRNGYHETGSHLRYEGDVYELLCNSENFNRDLFARKVEQLQEAGICEIAMVDE